VYLVLIVAAAAGWSSGPSDDVIEQRRSRLERMTDAEKTALLEKKRRFDDLPDEQKYQLRKLCEDLTAHPQRDHLRKLLERYNDWLRTLSPGTKAEILSLPIKQRVARIEADLNKPDPQRFQRFFGSPLSREDLNVINQWLDQFIDHHIKEILAALPDNRFDEIKLRYDPDKHRRRLAFILFRLESPNLPRPTREDEQRLQEALSPEAQKVLKNGTSEEEVSQMLGHWIRGATFFRVTYSFSREELDKFVATIDANQRERLESLPRDQMYRELNWMYFGHWYRESFGDPMPGPGGRRGGPGSGRWPGPGRGWPSGGWPPPDQRSPDQSPPGMGPGGQMPPGFGFDSKIPGGQKRHDDHGDSEKPSDGKTGPGSRPDRSRSGFPRTRS
jgi:hypothetical protein